MRQMGHLLGSFHFRSSGFRPWAGSILVFHDDRTSRQVGRKEEVEAVRRDGKKGREEERSWTSISCRSTAGGESKGKDQEGVVVPRKKPQTLGSRGGQQSGEITCLLVREMEVQETGPAQVAWHSRVYHDLRIILGMGVPTGNSSRCWPIIINCRVVRWINGNEVPT